MDVQTPPLWYFVAFFGLFVLCLVIWGLKRLLPDPTMFYLKHFGYRMLFSSGRYIALTRIEAFILSIFIAGNVVVILAPFENTDITTIGRRAVQVAVVNLAPLCIGGHAPIVDTLNVSRHSYNLFHRWLGLIVVIEAVSHVVIVLRSQPQIAPTMQLSGWIATSLLCTSLYFGTSRSKKIFGRWSMALHRVVSIGALGVLLWHVLNTQSIAARMIIACSSGFWVFTTLFRLCRLTLRWNTGSISSKVQNSSAVRIDVALSHNVKVHPGCYFHIFLPGRWFQYDVLTSLTAVAVWIPSEDGSRTATNLSFLLCRGISPRIIDRLAQGQSILLDGPYGREMRLESRENIILAAKGIGLAGVIPLALDLAARKRHDDKVKASLQKKNAHDKMETRERFRDSVKKIDLFWVLEHNEQMDWAAEYLKALQQMDLGNRLLVVWCGYPSHRTGHDPFKLSQHWKCFDTTDRFEDVIESKITEERDCLPGRLNVTVCGDSKFMFFLRRAVLKAMQGQEIEYRQLDYVPYSQRGRATTQQPLPGRGRGQATCIELHELPGQSRFSEDSVYSTDDKKRYRKY